MKIKSIDKLYSYTYKEKKSTFVAYFFPLKDFENLYSSLSKEHKKASHIVYLCKDFKGELKKSDDKEPKGSATKPMEANLKGHDFYEVALIIVRYFGGKKLGLGPLFRAYNKASKEVIKLALE